MNKDWSNHSDIVQRIKCLWDNGRLLAERLHEDSDNPLFPLRIPLKTPTANELDCQFDYARQWIARLQEQSKKHGYGLEWHSRRHRVHGENRLPVAVLFETPDSALRLIGKIYEAQCFDQLCNSIISQFPVLQDWLVRKPLTVLKYQSDWPRLLAVINWLCEHPRPGIYLRQIDVPGVHTKFIETHRGLLIALLDQVLPESAIDKTATGVRCFETRYGFRNKPQLVRFRMLDSHYFIQGLSDLSIPLQDFVRLNPHISTVIITENDINGLALPPIKDTLVIFGLGYGLDVLKQVGWLTEKRLLYWGDIDTHGFVMLDQLRQIFDNVRSLLMDKETLLEHQSLWGSEPQPVKRELSFLRSSEQGVYQSLLHNHYQDALRLEQERIGFHWIKKYLRDADLDQFHKIEGCA